MEILNCFGRGLILASRTPKSLTIVFTWHPLPQPHTKGPNEQKSSIFIFNILYFVSFITNSDDTDCDTVCWNGSFWIS
jgi:hypothetical protein